MVEGLLEGSQRMIDWKRFYRCMILLRNDDWNSRTSVPVLKIHRRQKGSLMARQKGLGESL